MDETPKRIEIAVAKGVTELIIREGKALLPKKHIKVAISGNINSVIDFIKKRDEICAGIDKKAAHIIINDESGSITLVCDEKDEYGTVIQGNLEKHPELVNLHINGEKTFDLKGLIKHLKFKKHLFADKNAHTDIMKKLMSFTAKIQTEISAQNDLKGNKVESLISNALTNLDLDFYVETELFKGFAKEKFKTDINFDVLGQNDITFWLESSDLAVKLPEEKRLILIEKQMEFEGIVVINQ